MIKLKPAISVAANCPYCQQKLKNEDLRWQGIHVGINASCQQCHKSFCYDAPIGHAIKFPYIVDLQNFAYFTARPEKFNWFGKPFAQSLQKPNPQKIKLEVKTKKTAKKIVIVNCLDYLYEHCLLKLLNVDQALKNQKKLAVVVIVPKILAWAVPKQVAEVWVVNLPIKQTQNYYPYLEEKIKAQLTRFQEIYLYPDLPHPTEFNITDFTQVKPYKEKKNYRITFIWREDRPWISSSYLGIAAKKFNLLKVFNYWQKQKIIKLFLQLHAQLPQAKLTIAGIGKSFAFPDWIDDQRLNKVTPQLEKHLCQVYAESKIVLGVHGSNLLLPSAHTWATISLLPKDRLGSEALPG